MDSTKIHSKSFGENTHTHTLTTTARASNGSQANETIYQTSIICHQRCARHLLRARNRSVSRPFGAFPFFLQRMHVRQRWSSLVLFCSPTGVSAVLEIIFKTRFNAHTAQTTLRPKGERGVLDGMIMCLLTFRFSIIVLKCFGMLARCVPRVVQRF